MLNEELYGTLTQKQLFSISEFAKAKRRELDLGMSSLGDNIFQLVRRLGIHLIFIPVRVDEEKNDTFSAIYVCFNNTSIKELSFIGLNTVNYFDEQIFALAHELYHHFEKCEIHFCRLSDNMLEREIKANKFATEFLLPTEKLKLEIQEINGGDLDLSDWKHSTLLRFIARLHYQYGLLYKEIIRRLFEIEAITNNQYKRLCEEVVRDTDGEYYRIGRGIESEFFEILNKRNFKSGADGLDLEVIIRNYEDDIISISELAETLDIFEKKLVDFGIEEEVNEEDLVELAELFEESRDNDT